MTIEITLNGEILFNSAITRFSLMDSMLSAQLVGGYRENQFQKNRLYVVTVTNGEEIISKNAEFMSYNYNIQSTYKIDRETNSYALDEQGNKIIENMLGENSLLFKVF